jgi:rod shape-determining protein MreD
MIEAVFIYFWCIYRPRNFPYWFAFLIGILWDILYGWPIGLSALACVALRFIVVHYREHLHSTHFSDIWRSAAFILLIYSFCKWLALSVMNDMMLPTQTALFQWALTVSLYPFFHAVLNGICHILPEGHGDA